METANLGEYEMRLELLYAFHCQLVHVDQTDKQGELILKNDSSNLFCQFIRLPIRQKKLLGRLIAVHHSTKEILIVFFVFEMNSDNFTQFLPGVLLRMLWNVYQYYKQFLTNVQEQIHKVRQPIEKQLKVKQNISWYRTK